MGTKRLTREELKKYRASHWMPLWRSVQALLPSGAPLSCRPANFAALRAL